MPGLFEINQVGQREDLLDVLTRVDEKATRFLSMCPRGSTPRNTYMEWPVDDYDAPKLGGVVDGTDVTNFENHAKNRALLSTYLQTFRRAAKVSRLAQEVPDIAGVASEIAESISKKTVELGRDIESTLLSDQEHQQESGADPYLTRGLGVWIRDTTNIAAQTSHQVPVLFRPAAGQAINTATASLTEDDIQTLFQTIWTATGMTGDFKLFCDAVLRRRFTTFTRTIATAGYASRDFTFAGDSTTVKHTTTVFEGDFGAVEVVADNFIGFNAAGSSQEAGRGYLLDMDKLMLRWHKMPTVEQFEDQGGGERFMIEGRCALAVRNPLGLAQFSPSLS